MINDLARDEQGGDGPDFTWVLTWGADMSWQYAFHVHPLLVDLDAAESVAAWPLCVDICFTALQALAVCEQRGAGISNAAPQLEEHARLATDDSPSARALRVLPLAVSASQADAEQAIATVRKHAAELRRRLPLEMPVLRSAAGKVQSMRLSASIIKWRKERGLGMPEWGYTAEMTGELWA